MLAAWPNQISQCYAGCGEDAMPGCADDGGAESGASRARRRSSPTSRRRPPAIARS